MEREDKKILKFPANFLWGTSTSAHQVEGGNFNDWTEWEKSESRIKNLELSSLIKKYGLENYISGRACDHYHLYEQDFDLARELGHNAHRFSIEWSRIEPEQGKFNQKEIEHYRKVLLALRERDLEPFVTLWHWTNPLWLFKKGGWANKQVVNYFERYTKIIVQELGDLIGFWVTLNEPMVHMSHGYLKGNFPPGQKSIFQTRKVFNNLIKAHQAAYQVIHSQYPKAQVSIANLTNYFEPAHKWCPLEQLMTGLAHYFWNDRFLKKIKNQLDYIGLDYYFHNRIVWYPPFKKNLNQKTTDLGWEIYPEGIYYVLKYLAKFSKPIYILENGLADAKDKKRAKFIREHLYWTQKAIQEGIDVRGYFHWSLLDNFEWDKGFWPRFGLIEVDYQTLERKPRPSAYLYAQICRTGIVP